MAGSEVGTVVFGSQAWVPPPYRCRDIELMAYLAVAGRDELHALCDKVFTRPTNGAVAYAPWGHHVVITFGRIGRLESAAPQFEGEGSTSEAHCGIWVLLRRKKGSLGPPFAVFNPYMWVDNPMSLVAGRDVFGYAKSWGWPAAIARTETSNYRGHTLDVLGGNFRAGEVRSRRELISVRSKVQRQGDVDVDVGGAERIEGFERFISHWIRGSFAEVFLKQVPDVSGRGIALQQVCTARIKVEHFCGTPVLRRYDLGVERLDSDPVEAELGLGAQEIYGGFRVDAMDMTLEPGEVVWDARG